MQVKLFSGVFCPGTPEAEVFELEINGWLDRNVDIEILSMTVSSSERANYINMVFFVVYEERDDDEGDELTVTLPHITVKDLSPLIPRLK